MRPGACGLGRLWQREDGATAVEFAIVLGPLIFLLGCIIEMSVMLFSEYTLQDGVQEAGRLIRTAAPDDSTALRTEICSRTLTLPNCSAQLGLLVNSEPNYGALSVPDLADVGPGSDNYTKPAASSSVVLLVTYDWSFIFPGLNLLSNVEAGGSFRRLQGVAVFQVEPP